MALLLHFVLGAYLSRYSFRLRPLDGFLLQWLGRISYSPNLAYRPILSYASRQFGHTGVCLAIPMVFAASLALTLSIDEPSVRFSRSLARRVRQAITGPALQRLGGGTRLSRASLALWTRANPLNGLSP
jgi:peptidoglycan/LPS O-acetylase OafA/YrhL